MKIQVEIDDTLEERVVMANEEVKDLAITAIMEYRGASSDTIIDTIYDRTGEIADSNVPVYTKEIDDIWYLHKIELVDAYNEVDFGDDPMENNGATAIYCYVEAKMGEYVESIRKFIDGEWEELDKQMSEEDMREFIKRKI